MARIIMPDSKISGAKSLTTINDSCLRYFKHDYCMPLTKNQRFHHTEPTWCLRSSVDSPALIHSSTSTFSGIITCRTLITKVASSSSPSHQESTQLHFRLCIWHHVVKKDLKIRLMSGGCPRTAQSETQARCL